MYKYGYNKNMKKHEILTNLRIKNNYSHADMAHFLNISKPFYWQLENKKRTLTYEMAIKIASILKSKPDQIFYNDYVNKK